MGRTVSAWVTSGGECLGMAGPFPVDVPWWSEMEPVVARLRQALGVPVLVLRLLGVEGGDGMRDGHVTYHAEALRRPAAGLVDEGRAAPAALAKTEELRAPWAHADGLRELLDRASATLAAAGRPVTGPVEQRKTWNLAGIFRLPTDRGPVWLKATPHFAADEAAVVAAFARVDPGLVPTVLAAGERRLLMEHLPGEDCWNAPAGTVADVVTRLVAAQAEVTDLPPGLPDRRMPVLADRVRELLDGDGETARELTPGERAAALGLLDRLPALEDCGLPDTLVHGDFHPGNARSDGGPPVLVDFADSHLGNPVLDGLRMADFLSRRGDARAAAVRAWTGAWRARVPGCDPTRALAVAEPLAHLAYAVRYQEFLDGIEPSERVYHRGDPAASVRNALHSAAP